MLPLSAAWCSRVAPYCKIIIHELYIWQYSPHLLNLSSHLGCHQEVSLAFQHYLHQPLQKAQTGTGVHVLLPAYSKETRNYIF